MIWKLVQRFGFATAGVCVCGGRCGKRLAVGGQVPFFVREGAGRAGANGHNRDLTKPNLTNQT